MKSAVAQRWCSPALTASPVSVVSDDSEHSALSLQALNPSRPELASIFSFFWKVLGASVSRGYAYLKKTSPLVGFPRFLLSLPLQLILCTGPWLKDAPAAQGSGSEAVSNSHVT